MIGNDIVDLRQASRESNWRRRGYLGKIFTREEQQLIETASAPNRMVWMLWSCKEAAYKVWADQVNARRYLPRKIRIDSLISTGEECYQARAGIEGRDYKLSMRVGDNYVHTWTIPPNTKRIVVRTFPLHSMSSDCQSARVRAMLIRYLEREEQWAGDAIHIRKTEQGRPVIHYQDEEMPTKLSISHHGYYGGFALMI